jgi:hypothetical protein
MAFLAAIPAALGLGGIGATVGAAGAAADVAANTALLGGGGIAAAEATAGAAAAAGGGLTSGLGAASLIGQAGSTLIGMAGQRQTAAAQAASANYQAQVALNNQTIAQQNARYAQQAGAVNAQAQDFQTRKLLGEQMAAQGASGIDLTTGSPFDVTQSTRQLGRLDTANIIQRANMEAYGYQTAATSAGAQAGLLRQQAGFAQTAGGIGAAGTLLGGASSLATKWLQYQQRGVPGFGDLGAGGV